MLLRHHAQTCTYLLFGWSYRLMIVHVIIVVLAAMLCNVIFHVMLQN